MKKSLKRIFAGLLSAVTLGCCLPAMTLGANAAETKTYPRDFSYMTSAYGYFFYPETDSEGNVTAQAYSTLASDYYDNHVYMHEKRDFTFDTWLCATFSATEDGYLKIGTTSKDSNSMGLTLNQFKGILEYSRVGYVCVSYKILGKTVSESDNQRILVGPSSDWGNAYIGVPITNTNDDWNFAYVSTADLNRSGNWLVDDGSQPQFRIQLPDFNDTSVSIVLNYVGFCKDLDALNATKTKIEKANSVVENSVANRRYGSAATGLYFNQATADDAIAELTVTKAGSTDAKGTVNLVKWVDDTLAVSATDEGFVRLTSSASSNPFTMKSSGNYVSGNVSNLYVAYIIIRFKIDGASVPTDAKILFGDGGNWGVTNKRADVSLTGTDADADGWITLCCKSANHGNDTALLQDNSSLCIAFGGTNLIKSSVVIDYIGLCADEAAKDETLAAIELANSVRLVGVQASTNASDHALRFIGKVKAESVDALNEKVDQLGLRLTVGTQTADVEITKVYQSILSGDETLTADEGWFFFTFVVRNIPADTQTDFTVTPLAVAAGESDAVLGLSATLGYDATANELVKAKKN